MPVDDDFPLTDLGSTPADRLWSPRRFEFYQLRDTLDLRAVWTDGTTDDVAFRKVVFRAQSNGDTQFYGELFLKEGGLRFEKTAIITALANGEDILSLRAGPGPGNEVLRVTSDGALQGAYDRPLVLRSWVTPTVTGTTPVPAFSLSSKLIPAGTQPFLRASVDADGTETRFLDLYADTTDGPAVRAATASAALPLRLQSTHVEWQTEGGTGWTRTLRISGDATAGPTLSAHNGLNARPLTLQASLIEWQSDDGPTRALRLTGSGATGVTANVGDGTLRSLAIESSEVTLPFDGSGGWRGRLYRHTSLGGLAIDSGTGTSPAPMFLGASTLRLQNGYLSAARLDVTPAATGTTIHSYTGTSTKNTLALQSSGITWDNNGLKLSITSSVSSRVTFDVGDGTTARELKVQASQFSLRSSPTGSEWGYFTHTGAYSLAKALDHLVITSRDPTDTTYRNVTVSGCNVMLVANCTNGLVTILDSETTTAYFVKQNPAGSGTYKSKSGTNASIFLDSTVNTGGKQWELRADRDSGDLRFANLTDTGTPTVRVDAKGSLIAGQFLATKEFTASPSDAEGEVGSIAVDTTNKRLWVKVASTGSGRWWHASLTSP